MRVSAARTREGIPDGLDAWLARPAEREGQRCVRFALMECV